MEFASEIIVKACLLDMQVMEVPTILSPAGQDRPPHLRSWRDGWRRLRFLLIFSPRWLFLYPGIILVLAGILASSIVVSSSVVIRGVTLDIHTLILTSALIPIGFNAVSFAILTRIYALQAGLMPRKSVSLRLFDFVTLELGLVCGIILVLLGISGASGVFAYWAYQDFGPLAPSVTMRILIPSAMSLILGAQVVFTSFFLSLLGLPKK